MIQRSDSAADSFLGRAIAIPLMSSLMPSLLAVMLFSPVYTSVGVPRPLQRFVSVAPVISSEQLSRSEGTDGIYGIADQFQPRPNMGGARSVEEFKKSVALGDSDSVR